MVISIHKNKKIDRIKIGNNETKILQYADNTTAVLSNLDSANALFQLLDGFKNLCGLEINSSKTEGMWIGSQNNNDEKPLGINWPNEPTKALEYSLHTTNHHFMKKNFQNKLDNIWSSRGLSIYGKVTIIKSLLIPKLVFVSSLLPTPSNIIKQVNDYNLQHFYGKGNIKC